MINRYIGLIITIIIFIIILAIAIYVATLSNATLDDVDEATATVDSVVKTYCNGIKTPNSILTIPQSAIDRCNAIEDIG